MKAELLLSRPGYQAGKPVVGTIRIHHDDAIPVTNSAQNDNVDGNSNSRPQQGTKPPIREMIVSARIYLAGRAHLGSSARDKSSRWRSAQEINQLKNIYGDHHPCLSVAKAEEQSRWSEWNDGIENAPEDGPSDDVETFTNDTEPTRITSFIRKIEPPQVPHIEQAERLSVLSCLHHSSSTFAEQIDKSTGGNQPSDDFSHLPAPHENNVICVWMTNVFELLGLPERHLDRKCLCAKENACQCQLRPGRGKFYGDMYPYRPLQLPDMNVVKDVWEEIENKMSNDHYLAEFADDDPNCSSLDRSSLMSSYNVNKYTEEEMNHHIQNQNSSLHSRFDTTNAKTVSLKSQSAWRRIVDSANPPPDLSSPSIAPLEERQLAFSFRANLPSDVPPTMSAECVKYFYSAVLAVTTVEGKLLFSHCPFIVLKSDSRHYSNQEQIQPASTTRVQIGNLCAIAHSTALPTYITSTAASSASSSQLTTVENPPACDIVSRRTIEERMSTHHIEDENGGLCAMMTLIGFGGPLLPGTRLGIRIQFPCSYNDTISGKRVIPCHRVCCAIVGEECAVHEVSGGDNPQKSKIRVKTRNYVFDSAYELVEFGYTESISMGLVLPLNCPVTVKTDLVEVTVVFKVEFTVSRTADLSSVAGAYDSNHSEYRVIQLDLPCEVANCSGESVKHFRDDSDEEVQATSIGMQKNFKSHYERHTEGVDDIDIHAELNVLSTRMLGSYINRKVHFLTGRIECLWGLGERKRMSPRPRDLILMSAKLFDNRCKMIATDRMHRLNIFYLISLLFCASAALLAAVSDAASPAPTNPSGQAGTASYLVTNSAKDAAVAMNSIGFISHLASYKESDDIKSYRQLIKPQPSSLYSHMTTHETVTEYKAKKIWFLPSMRDGVRFRETIRVISISADGKLSTVECTTQYHNGSRWVDCARVLCKFTSNVLDSKVKMSLENEVLVWLPLPNIAIRAVGKKILSVFEQAALDFFYQKHPQI